MKIWPAFGIDAQIALIYLSCSILIFFMGDAISIMGFRGIANTVFFWSLWLFLVAIYFTVYRPCQQRPKDQQPQ